MKYGDVVYNYRDRPLTDYPYQLCGYLHENQLCTLTKSKSTILDLGCGRGDFSNAFKDYGYSVFSFDKEYNDKYHINLNWYRGEMIDVIFCKSVLEHIEQPKEFLLEWKKRLYSQGKIIILVPDWKSQSKIFYDDPTHIRPFTQEGLRELMLMCDFKNVHTEVFYQLPIVWNYPWIKSICKMISLIVKPEHYPRNKFIRWSTEKMILGVANA